MKKKKPEIKTLRGLEKRALRFIESEGCFLLIYDVVGSKKARDRALLQEELQEFAKAAQKFCEKEIVRDASFSALGRNPFVPVLGDAGGAYLKDSRVIYAILTLSKKIVSLPLRWNIAENEWDEKNMKTIK